MMRGKKIILNLLLFCFAVSLGYCAALFAYISKQDKKIALAEEDALLEYLFIAEESYYHMPPEISTWALEKYVHMLERLISERKNKKTGNKFYMIFPEKELQIAHGRLAKLYKQIEDEEKAEYHTDQAVKAVPNTVSAENMDEFIKGFDEAQKNKKPDRRL